MNSRSFLPLFVSDTPTLNGGCHTERSDGAAFPLGPDKFLAQITRIHEIVIPERGTYERVGIFSVTQVEFPRPELCSKGARWPITT